MKTLLSIAGFDPSSGAGITADLQVFAAHGCFGTSAITALTAQSTRGVTRVEAIHCTMLRATLDELTADLPPAGVKLGMMGSRANVEVVAEFLTLARGKQPGLVVVLDPVMRSTGGEELLEAHGLVALRDMVLPLVDWVTPNVDELAMLTDNRDAEQGAAALARDWPGLSVVVTGGDGASADDLVRVRGGRIEWLRGEKIVSEATHGTGCAFSSALLCGLVGELDGLAAARAAKAYVAQAIRSAEPMGSGKGPMNLLWPLRSRLEQAGD